MSHLLKIPSYRYSKFHSWHKQIAFKRVELIVFFYNFWKPWKSGKPTAGSGLLDTLSRRQETPELPVNITQVHATGKGRALPNVNPELSWTPGRYNCKSETLKSVSAWFTLLALPGTLDLKTTSVFGLGLRPKFDGNAIALPKHPDMYMGVTTLLYHDNPWSMD